MSQVILEFVGDTSGLKPVVDALSAIGNITKENQEKFKQANDASRAALAKETTEVSKLTTGLKEMNKAVAGAAIKEATKDLSKFSNELVTAGKQATTLKGKLREIKAELATIDDEGSPRFQKLAIEAAKLEDKIGDVSERIRVLASDTFAIDAVVDGVRGLTAAFTVAQSASALFGKENEDVQKALLKVQAATGLLIGVQEIANQLTGQGAAKLAVLSAAQKAYTFVVGTTTGALKAMRIALAGLGIGAIIFVLYEAASAMGLFGEETQGVTEDIEKLNKATSDLKETEEDLRASRLQNSASVLSAIIQSGEKTIESLKAVAEVENFLLEDSKKKNKEKIDAIVKEQSKLNERLDYLDTVRLNNQEFFFDETLQKVVRTNDENLRLNISSAQTLLAEKSKEYNELLQAQEAFGTQQQLNEIRLANEINEINKAAQEERERNARKAITQLPTLPIIGAGQIDVDEKKAADEQKLLAERDYLDRLKSMRDAFDAAEAERIARELKATEEKAAIKLQIEQAAFQAIGMILDEQFNRQQEQIQANLNAELNALNEQQQAILANESLTATQKEAIQKQFAQKEAEAKKKAWIAERDAAVEQALINGLLSFTTSLATQGYPAGLITGALALALAGVQAGLIASKQPPAFAKGTDYAPGGAAWVGEKGTELVVEPSGKKWLTPNQATLMDIKQGSQIIPNFRLDDYANMIPSVPESMLNQFEQNKTSTIDYGRLGKEFAKELGKNPMLSVNIDRNGVNLLIKKGNRSINYLNNKFRN